MITAIITLALLCGLFGIGYAVTGALLTAAIWIFIKFPVALFLWGLALALCCTILLIPVGAKLFGVGFKVLV